MCLRVYCINYKNKLMSIIITNYINATITSIINHIIMLNTNYYRLH